MFSLDLKRLYYGAVAFLIFLIAFFATQVLATSLLRLPVISSVPLEERQPPIPTPLAPPTTAVPVAVDQHLPTPVPTATLTPEQQALVQETERVQEDWALHSAKESVASSLAIVLVTLPVWFWHWRRWRALTRTELAQFFRLYVYALMLVALVTAIVHAASALGKVLTWLLGIADLATRFATLTFAQELVGNLLGALIAGLAWWYHWTNVRGENETG